MSAPNKRRFTRGRAFWASLAAASVALFGFGLMTGPANATDGNSGSVDTSVTSSYIERGGERTKGGDDDRCKPGDVCQQINWCDKDGNNPHPRKLADDAPLVFTGDKGKGGHDGPKDCIKRPDIGYKCCVVTDKGTTKTAIMVNNKAKYPFKVKAKLGDAEPIIKWVGAGETVTFTFEGVENGEHELVVAVAAGKGKWCVFKVTKVKVKCVKPTPSTSTPPTDEPSTPPTSSSPEPSESTQAPGGGGGDNEPQLPVTGAPAGGIIATGIALVVIGVAAVLFVRRRRATQFSA